MVMALKQTLCALEKFATEGTVTGCIPYGNGHINDTFLVTCLKDKKVQRYILQAINTDVFPYPEQVMSNIQKVTAFLKEKGAGDRRVLKLVPTENGEFYLPDTVGRCWRMYEFIEESLCLEHPENKDDFYQCAVAFGDFQRKLGEFPAGELFETIKDFHNTPKRFADFEKAVNEDVCGRVSEVTEEIAFIRERKDFYSVLINANREGRLPLRVTHNDTKSNNVMLDEKTRTALCVIDLDTIMPGFSVNDFGDSIRFGASTAAEDEKDLDKVNIDLEMFGIYTKGFLDGCGGMLGSDEIMLMPEGAKMMTIECGMRFLADYLQGDVYFKTGYPEHNLVRCRTQLKLVADMEKNWDTMKNIVKKYTEV